MGRASQVGCKSHSQPEKPFVEAKRSFAAEDRRGVCGLLRLIPHLFLHLLTIVRSFRPSATLPGIQEKASHPSRVCALSVGPPCRCWTRSRGPSCNRHPNRPPPCLRLHAPPAPHALRPSVNAPIVDVKMRSSCPTTRMRRVPPEPTWRRLPMGIAVVGGHRSFPRSKRAHE